MKNEYAITILLSNPFLNQITLKRIEHILKQPVNWHDVFLYSLEHRTTFVICRNLLQYRFFWLVPDSLWLVWQAAYIGNAKKNKQLLNYYDILRKKFFKNKIFAIPGNGIMLLATVYYNMLGARILHDIDFFTKKKYLKNIDNILHDLDFKKIYVNDKDIFTNLPQTYGNDTLYSKHVNSIYINCDFCSGMKEYPTLYKFLINAMNSKNYVAFHAAQLTLLYLSTEKSWKGEYLMSNLKEYTYARLIDLHLYNKRFVNSEVQNVIKREMKNFHLTKIIKDVDIALAFFRKEGYLT